MTIQAIIFDFLFRVVDILSNESNRKIIETKWDKNFVERAICKIVNWLKRKTFVTNYSFCLITLSIFIILFSVSFFVL